MGVGVNGDDNTAAAEPIRLHGLLALAREAGRLSLWDRDRDTGEGHWEPDIFRLFGLPVADRSPPVEVSMARVHPDDRGPALATYRRSLGHPGRHEVRYRVPHADGRVTWVHSIWQVPEQGRRIFGVIIDDSATAELARQHAFARTHLDLAADVAGIGLWSLDLRSGEQVWNPTMKALHGLAADAPVPASDASGVSAQVLPEDRPRLATLLVHMQSPQAPRAEGRWRIRHPDGSVRTLVGSARRLDGDQPVIAGVAMDVTRLQAAEEALRDKAAAEQASRVKSEFLSRMSHELRTPLNAVLGFSELLLTDAAEPPRPLQRERLQHLRLAGRQLLSLIDEVLEITRVGTEGSDTGAATAALQALFARQSTEEVPVETRPPGRDGVCHELVYVEDNPVNLLLVQQIVAQRPHLRLHAATTVDEGEALIRRLRPALVLMDLHLPDGDGFDLLRRLRGGSDPVVSPCVVLSADAQPQQIERALAAGFEAYWTKPVDVGGILAALDARLSA
jgi:CheY-like chemotaxis protein/PAS domain-containing protein